ncbi:MAG TPA: ABC transporter substrate binding protein [candidate division Zixibacteria bacterium]|nr:ABC transporter substrate binding protein [candidate division Zixibacteria bacterium]
MSALLFPVSAAQAQNVSRIAVIGAPEEPRFSEVLSGLRKGLEQAGYTSESIHVEEVKIARAEKKSATAVVERLVQKDTRVLFLIGSRLVKPARAASKEVPIVFITPGDPVASGLVDSLARPGRRTTGMTFEYPELSGK